MPRTRIAVVFGGRSSEHAISCISAASVLRALDPGRYEVLPVGILPDGRWVLDRTAPGRTWFALDPGPGQPSRWVTLKATRVLRWWDDQQA